MSLTEFLINKGFSEFEGHSQNVPPQVEDLIKITNQPNIRVMEIGFNAGHSADVFLKSNPSLTLTSFDIGIHDYVETAKGYIDAVYPGRHTLILGDSLQTVPKYLENNKGTKFDVIFIDGDHTYEVAKADMENCFRLAHKDTVVILDDTMFTSSWTKEWNVGPTRIWSEYLNQSKIVEFKRRDYGIGRGMCWGKYAMSPKTGLNFSYR
jgi:hypothetical protein